MCVDFLINLISWRDGNLQYRRHRHLPGKSGHGNQRSPLYHRARRVRLGRGPGGMTDSQLRDRVRDYYEGLLQKHGATPLGVDWKSESSQALRFRQLAHLWEDEPDASVIDYGCGYGALADYLRSRGHRGAYTGFDISRQMTNSATQRAGRLANCEWTSDRSQLQSATYAVASGIFNVKLDVNDD